MSIILNIFTFPTQIEAVQALQKLEQLEDEKILSKFVLLKDPVNKPYLIEKSKDGLKYKQYLDQENEGTPFELELTTWEALKTHGFGFHDQYFAAIEKGVPAGKAVLVVFAYAGWDDRLFAEFANSEYSSLQATINADITSPDNIAAMVAARFLGKP